MILYEFSNGKVENFVRIFLMRGKLLLSRIGKSNFPFQSVYYVSCGCFPHGKIFSFSSTFFFLAALLWTEINEEDEENFCVPFCWLWMIMSLIKNYDILHAIRDEKIIHNYIMNVKIPFIHFALWVAIIMLNKY